MQTGEMLSGIEQVLLRENPDWVMVYGDTNSTLAAAKLHTKIAHIEAGLRSYNRLMPEEINRVLTDHISTLLFCPSEVAVRNLAKEGIVQGVYNTGDVMLEALWYAVEQGKDRPRIADRLGIKEGSYILATPHRAETTDDEQHLRAVIEAFNCADKEIIFPVHPRTRRIIEALNIRPAGHVHFIEPVGYFDMVQLEKSACLIMTDSGGVQKEAYWLKVPCITLRQETEWVETVQTGWNRLTGYDLDKIIEFMQNRNIPKEHPSLYGGREAIREIVNILETYR